MVYSTLVVIHVFYLGYSNVVHANGVGSYEYALIRSNIYSYSYNASFCRTLFIKIIKAS